MNVKEFDVVKFDSILARGLSHGLGKQGQQVCIEAAICETLGLPHGDDPGCVSNAVRAFKIRLNDSPWSSVQARAAGLRDLGVAQLGSKDVVDDRVFAQLLAEKTIRVLLPKLFRQIFKDQPILLAAADQCEAEGTRGAAYAANAAAYAAAYAANAAYAAVNAAYAAYAAVNAADNAAAYAANAAVNAAVNAAYYAANAAAARDEYLKLSASLALEVLRELKSPGVELLLS